jgi:hypothetical protein
MASCTDAGCRQITRSSKVSFEDCIFDQTRNLAVRDREFAVLDLPGKPAPTPPPSRLEKLASGFYKISGAAVDPTGRLYFVDSHDHRIYRYTPETKDLRVIRDNPLDPVNLVFDKAGNLIVVSSGGKGLTVYALRPDGPEDELAVLPPEPAADRPGLTPVLPVDYWANGDFTDTLDLGTLQYTTLEQIFTKHVGTRRTYNYVSPDHTLFIPADEAFIQGPPYFGYKFADILQCFGLVKATPGKPFYVTNESEQRTYVGTANADGTLTNLRTFAEQGGESLAQDAQGNVYIAAGQIYVYTPAAKLIETIQVPVRPLDIVFGGKDNKTLYILTQSTLYVMHTK